MSLAQFIQSIATKRGHTLHDGPIDITIPYARIRYKAGAHNLFPGCVYGLAVELNKDQKRFLFEDTRRLQQNNLDVIDKWKPIYGGNVYPLYWGKEWSSGNRLYFHLSGSKGNGALCLYEQNYPRLEKLNLLYASVRVSSHKQLEKYLLSNHAPLMKTVPGKGPDECP